MRFYLIILLFLSATFVSKAGDSVFQPGEVLEYEVNFGFITLGKIVIETEGKENIGDEILYKAKAMIRSSEGIPFVSLIAKYESWMSPNLSYSYKFVGNTKFLSDKWSYQKIQFDYPQNSIFNELWIEKKLSYRDTVHVKKKWNDGTSLFFLARQYLHLNKNVKIPTFMGRDTSYTYINFTGKQEAIDIDAVDYPIRTLYFKGKANWKGIYGLSGEFEGWFSDDDACVPIYANMEVMVGNVSIELIKWNRKGWKPPKA